MKKILSIIIAIIMIIPIFVNAEGSFSFNLNYTTYTKGNNIDNYAFGNLLDKVTSITIDNNEVEFEYLKDDDVIEIKSQIFESLANGEHDLVVNYTDGTYDNTINIKEASDKIKTLKALVPSEMNVNFKEIDAFNYNDNLGDYEVLIDLKNQLNQIFTENEHDLDSENITTYSYWASYNDIANYVLYISDKTDNTDFLKINVKINYTNSNEYNEEDAKKVEDLIKNNNFEFINYCELGKCEISEENIPDPEENINKILENTGIVGIYDGVGGGFYDISGGYSFNLALFVNDKMYDSVWGATKVVSTIEVPYGTPNKEEYVLEKVKEYLVSNNIIDENEKLSMNNNFIVTEENAIGEIKIIDGKPVEYTYLNGANSTIEKVENNTLTVRIDAPFNKFVSVFVNGNEIDKKYYSVSEGSTIIKFTEDYISSLKAGNYTLTAKFTDGEATTKFTINDNTNPQTSDNINNYIILLLITITGLYTALMYNKKLKKF